MNQSLLGTKMFILTAKHLTGMLELELEQIPNSSNFVKVLETLSCGLYSNNIEICKWCSKLLTKIGYDFG